MSDSKIPIWTYSPQPEVKSALPPLGRSQLQITEVDAKIVIASLKRAIADFDTLVDEGPRSRGGFEVDSIELHFGVNASGAVALIGKLEAGVEASIKVTLKRPKAE
jgi:hypothetical protein